MFLWTVRDSNPLHPLCHSGALPIELTAQCYYFFKIIVFRTLVLPFDSAFHTSVENYESFSFFFIRNRLHHPTARRRAVPGIYVHMFTPQTLGTMVGIPISPYLVSAMLARKIFFPSLKSFWHIPGAPWKDRTSDLSDFTSDRSSLSRLIWAVGSTGIEPVTFSMSTKRSTTELTAQMRRDELRAQILFFFLYFFELPQCLINGVVRKTHPRSYYIRHLLVL